MGAQRSRLLERAAIAALRPRLQTELNDARPAAFARRQSLARALGLLGHIVIVLLGLLCHPVLLGLL